MSQIQKCKFCGCTDYNACPGGCFWVTEDVCSSCVDKDPELAAMLKEK